MHKTTRRFRKLFDRLPSPIKRAAKEKFELLKNNPSHPSLQFKKIGKFWSVRITDFYRALAVQDGDDFIWVWIGTHGEYEELLKKK